MLGKAEHHKKIFDELLIDRFANLSIKSDRVKMNWPWITKFPSTIDKWD